MESFYILRLPSVALGQLLKHYNPFELLDLSQCSKRMSKQIRLGSTQHFKLSLNFRWDKVGIRGRSVIQMIKKSSEEMEQYDIIGTRSYENCTVPIAYDKKNSKKIYMFWDDVFIGVKTIGFHLRNLFGCPINVFCWDGPDSIENLERFKSTIYPIINTQSVIEDLDISIVGLDEKEFKQILDKLTVTRELCIELKLSPKFQYQFSPEPKMLWINHSIWFTLNNLLAANCVSLVLYKSSLTNEDVDLYLRKWKSGDYPKLEQLVITSNNFNNQLPILGMFPPIMDMTNQKGSRKSICHCTVGINRGVDIQRNDGVKAKIRLELKDEERSELRLIVWN